MNSDIEELLKDGIDRLTDGTRAPAGLAAQVRKRDGRRRLAIHGMTAAGAAAASAIAVAVATAGSGAAPQHHIATGPGPQHAVSSPGTPTSQPAQTVADVIRRTRRALGRHDLIMETLSSSGRIYSLVGTGKHKKVILLTGPSWSYRNITSDDMRLVSHSGHGPGPLWEREEFIQGPRLPGNRTQFTVIQVDYRTKTWSRRLEQVPNGPGPAPVKMTCSQRHNLSQPFAPDKTVLSISPDSIRAGLACGGLRIAGHGQVNGTAVIKLRGTSRLTSYRLTLDVSPVTYLPVRYQFGNLWWNYRWIEPTTANLAHLHVHAPAGFRQVAPAG